MTTLAINVGGSLLLGVLLRYALTTGGMAPPLRLGLTTGFCGGFTTFSAFSLDVMTMLQRGDWGVALGYVLASAIGSVAALALGLGVARAVA